jgi:alkaline phosphatase D
MAAPPTPAAPAVPPAPPASPDTRRRRLLQTGAAWAAGAPLFVRDARAADPPRFTLGVASGHPQPDSVVLWTRLMGLDLPAEVPVAWQLAHDEGFTRIADQGRVPARADEAHSVRAEPAGLAPDRWYFYRFEALGQQSATGRTRTAPAPDAPTGLRAALASCQRWEHGHYAAWRHAAEQPLDLVLFAGDYIYEYAAPPDSVRPHPLAHARTLAHYRERYALYKSDPALQAAHAAAPWVLIWDDHEVENDYANDLGVHDRGAVFLARRAAAYQAWWEHQPVPAAWRPQGPAMRIHHRLAWGRLAMLHAVDGRQHRDHQACPRPVRAAGSATVDAADCPALADPGRSLLGDAQERWLAEGWDPQRRWNLLLQTTLMARASRRAVEGPGTGRYWTDGWDGYAPARQRLLAAAADRGARDLVVLGGDVHAHYAADLKTDYDAPGAPVVASEFCTTSISSNGAPQLTVDRLLALNPHLRHGRSDQRGYIALDLDERGLSATLVAVERQFDPLSPCVVQARFVVTPGRPGPQRA